MNLTGREKHDFPLDEAAKWTKNYREKNPNETLAHYFGEKAIRKIFSQPYCIGMRIYYALNDEGEKQLIIVGVDKNGDDIYQGLIAERSIPCPPICGTSGPLNK